MDGVMSLIRNVTVTNFPLDGFSRIRVSEPRPILDAQFQYDIDPLQFEELESGAGNATSYSTTTGLVTLALGGTAAGYAKIQSYLHCPYQSGRSHANFCTGLFDAPVANVAKRIGYFNDLDGVFLEQNGTTDYRWVIRSSVSGSAVDTRYVARDDWNIDKLDGTGDSGISLNFERVQILVFDLQFLGMGRVRCGFDIAGEIVWAHEFYNANNDLAVPYMRTATLPVRAEIVSLSGTPTASMKFKCTSVMTEGGTDDAAGLAFGRTGPDATVNSATNYIPLIHLKPKTTFNTLVNRSYNILESIGVYAASASMEWVLCIGSSFSADPTWADHDATYSGMQYGTGGTLTTATDPGVMIAADVVASSASTRGAIARQISNRYPIALNNAGATRTLGTLSLYGRLLAAGSSNARGTFNWREIR